MAPGNSSPLNVIFEHEIWGNVNTCYFDSDSIFFPPQGNFKFFRKILVFGGFLKPFLSGSVTYWSK